MLPCPCPTPRLTYSRCPQKECPGASSKSCRQGPCSVSSCSSPLLGAPMLSGPLASPPSWESRGCRHSLLCLPRLGLFLRTATAAGSCPRCPLGPITHAGLPLPPLGPATGASWVLPRAKASLVSFVFPCKQSPAGFQQSEQVPAQMQPHAPSWAPQQDCLDASGCQNFREVFPLC